MKSKKVGVVLMATFGLLLILSMGMHVALDESPFFEPACRVNYLEPLEHDFLYLAEVGVEPLFKSFFSVLKDAGFPEDLVVRSTTRGFAILLVDKNPEYGAFSSVTTVHQYLIELESESGKHCLIFLERELLWGAEDRSYWDVGSSDQILHSSAPISDIMASEFATALGFGNSYYTDANARCLHVGWFGQRTPKLDFELLSLRSPEERARLFRREWNGKNSPNKFQEPARP